MIDSISKTIAKTSSETVAESTARTLTEGIGVRKEIIPISIALGRHHLERAVSVAA
jgi:hypothetical protein